MTSRTGMDNHHLKLNPGKTEIILISAQTFPLDTPLMPTHHTRNLQLIQNAAAHLVINHSRHSHVTPLFTSLQWLPVIASIKFKTLMLAFQAVKGSAPAYLQKIIRHYTPARPLCSATAGHLLPPFPYSTSRSRQLPIPGSTMVERPPHRAQNSRDSDHLQAQCYDCS